MAFRGLISLSQRESRLLVPVNTQQGSNPRPTRCSHPPGWEQRRRLPAAVFSGDQTGIWSWGLSAIFCRTCA